VAALSVVEDVDEIIISTESDEIAQTALSFGFDKLSIHHRSKENAQDHSSTESVMLEYIESAQLADSDRFLLVQATSPFTRTEDFSSAINLLQMSGKDSLLSVVRTKRFFWKEDGTPLNYDYKNRPRRQEFDGLLMENGAFYINSVGNIRTAKNRLSGEIALYEMPEYTALEIDEEHDWLIAEELMKRYNLPENKT